MSLPESQENGDESLTWQEIAEDNLNIVTFKGVIEGFTLVEPEDGEEKLPAQLLEAGNTVLYISSKIKMVRSHKEDFRQLLGDATSLVVVFWRIYNESGIPGTLWPPPTLRKVTNKLVDTAYSIYKLMKRKSEENAAKRILVGYFGLRDLGKFKKYHRKLNEVASGFQNGLINITIDGILREVIKDQAQHQSEEGEHSELSDNPIEEHVRKKARAADREASVESPRLHKGKAKVEVEESSEDEPVEENKATKKTARKQPEVRTGPKGAKGTQKTRPNNSTPESEDKGRRTRYQEPDEDEEEGTSSQRSRTGNAAQSKTRRRASPAYDDDEEYVTDVPVALKAQPKKKKKLVSSPKPKVQSTPVAPQYSISGFSFNNGLGNMANLNVGNIHNSTISNANNDHSVNTPRGRRKPA